MFLATKDFSFCLPCKSPAQNETVPNQINQPIQNPTLRWIFQIMEGIGVVRFYESTLRDPVREIIANLTTLRRKIITLLGGAACYIYGIA